MPTSRTRTVTSCSPLASGAGSSMIPRSRFSGNTAIARIAHPLGVLGSSACAKVAPRGRGRIIVGMSLWEVENVLAARARLGECPVWDPERELVVWVDVYNHRV